MANKSKSSSIPTSKPLYPIVVDSVPYDVMFWGNEHKVDPSDTTAFSYHLVETVADGTSKDIIVPFSINSVQCQSFITNRVCSGSMGTSSQGSHYVFANGISTASGWSTTRMINLWVWTVTCTINGRILTIANSWVWATITTILTFFA
mgnify:FL=1